jgi:ADP-ribosyl-[dinitrogen reductase] hydrolase
MSGMRRARQRGCFLGLAVGDALGAAVEFHLRGTFPPVTDYRAGGPHGLAPGEWTDDTSMALALADSIATVGWDLSDQARRYLDWYHYGRYSVIDRCFDIGMGTSHALHQFELHGDPLRSASDSTMSSGNGSIMRLAPVPIRYGHLAHENPLELARYAEESSLPTHASDQCLSTCRYLALVLSGLIEGLNRSDVLDPEWFALRELHGHNPPHSALQPTIDGSFRTKTESEISSSGYVIDTIEAALWAFHDAASFEEAVLRAVNLGVDADSVGAVCGQLAGAYWGEERIPREWRNNLARRDLIDPVLDRLVEIE